MRHPPYHLRQNKAVDRFLLIETIKKIGEIFNLDDYTYFSLGGPYLEDFRLLYEFFPDMGMVSIEQSEDTIKRQAFHRPCSKVELVQNTLKSFLAQYDAKNKRSIFWLDYTKLEYGSFEDFQVLLEKVTDGSMIKITLRAAPRDYLAQDRTEKFLTDFEAVLPNPSITLLPRQPALFAKLLQDMIQIAAQKTLPARIGLTFQPLESFCYDDGTGMFTLTGIVCNVDNRKIVRDKFNKWRFSNLNWSRPKIIDTPFLSTKERLRLQDQLPCCYGAGLRLQELLGYKIDEDERESINMLQQYAEYHRCFPFFMKAIP